MLLSHAVGRHPGVSHPPSLPEFLGHRRSLRGMPNRSRAHDHYASRARVPRRTVSDLDRVAAALAAATTRRRRVPSRGARRGTASAPTSSSAWASSAGTSPRASSNGFQALEMLLDKNPRHRGQSLSAAGRGAVTQSIAGVPGAAAAHATSEVERINAKFAEVRIGIRSC